MGLLEEDLLHLSVLQIVQLSHSILGSLNEIHQHRVGTLALQKLVLWDGERKVTEMLVFKGGGMTAESDYESKIYERRGSVLLRVYSQ